MSRQVNSANSPFRDVTGNTTKTAFDPNVRRSAGPPRSSTVATQFFTVVGLTLFGVDKPTAAGFSFVVFFLLSVPLWIIGFVALSRTGMSFGRLRQEIRRTRLQSVDDRT